MKRFLIPLLFLGALTLLTNSAQAGGHSSYGFSVGFGGGGGFGSFSYGHGGGYYGGYGYFNGHWFFRGHWEFRQAGQLRGRDFLPLLQTTLRFSPHTPPFFFRRYRL